MTQFFEFLKSFFSWADESARKRQAKSVLCEASPAKRARRSPDAAIMLNGDIIDLCDDDDDVQIFKEVKCSSKTRKNRNSRVSRIASVCKSDSTTTTTMSTKNLLGIRSNLGHRFSTLNQSYRLREKAEYSKMLENFMPGRNVGVVPKKSDSRKGKSSIEVIDVENYKPSTAAAAAAATPEAFSTPKFRYTTSRPPSSSIITVDKVKLDDSDEIQEMSHQEKNNQVEPCSSSIPSRNSLRDKLAAKAVIKADFISLVAETYNNRMQQRLKEIEQVQKVSQVLAKRNRIHREVALEKQLATSLRLCEAVLEEADDYADEAELPELTEKMLEKVKKALNPRLPHDEVLVEAFGLRIMRKDIHTLAGLNWLNDEVINFYMNLLIDRGGKNNPHFPKVYAMNTFFYPKLLSGGHSSLKRWTRKVDIFSHDIVVVPIHLGMHWCMSIVDFRDKSIRYYDSMGGENSKCLQALRKYLIDECMDKKKQIYDTSDWIFESMTDIPQQMNGSDCGVFSCTFAEYICGNRNLNFSQDDMPYFRSKMVYEILHAKLL